MNARLITITTIALIAIMVSFIPSSFGDSVITVVQDNNNAQQSNSQATCTYGSNVANGNTLVVSLDAAFISHISSVTDTRGDVFTSIGLAVNSNSTWVRVLQAWTISGGSNIVTINYTSGGNGSYQVTCDEFLGQFNFTNVGGQGAGLTGCNQCNMNLTATLHAINLVLGWSDSSTAGYSGFAYSHLGSMLNGIGGGTCQAISGSSSCILAFHGFINSPVPVSADSAVILACSPACNQNPNFELAFYANNSVTSVTSTITGFLVPNFVNGLNSFSWLYFLLIVFIPMGEIVGIMTMERNSVLDRHAIIFVFLGLLLLDSIFGVMLNLVTVAMPFIFGTLFGIYLWRGRG